MPTAGLLADPAGDLFGIAMNGRATRRSHGIIFDLARKSKVRYDCKVLWSFEDSSEGAYPYGSLIADGSGNLYGTTSAGGRFGAGTVVEITP